MGFWRSSLAGLKITGYEYANCLNPNISSFSFFFYSPSYYFYFTPHFLNPYCISLSSKDILLFICASEALIIVSMISALAIDTYFSLGVDLEGSNFTRQSKRSLLPYPYRFIALTLKYSTTPHYYCNIRDTYTPNNPDQETTGALSNYSKYIICHRL